MAYRFSPCAPCCFTCNVPMPADDEILTAEFGFTLTGVDSGIIGSCNPAAFCASANGIWGTGDAIRPSMAYFTETVDYVQYRGVGSIQSVSSGCGSTANLFANLFITKPGGTPLNCINLNPPTGEPGGNSFLTVGTSGSGSLAGGGGSWTCLSGEADWFHCTNADAIRACKFANALLADVVRVDV